MKVSVILIINFIINVKFLFVLDNVPSKSRSGNASRNKDRNLQSPHKRTKTYNRNVDKEKRENYDDDGLVWGLPEHLNHLSHLLPTKNPELLSIKIPNNKNENDNDIVVMKEMPTRVKFPGKRMTIGEMKRRVRSVLEYVGRVQIEAADRRERVLDHRSSSSSSNGNGNGDKASESIQMLDDLTRELIRFNERFSSSTNAMNKRREDVIDDD